jgi:hypothetical protein
MSRELVPLAAEAPMKLETHQAVIPATIADAGDQASYRFHPTMVSWMF